MIAAYSKKRQIWNLNREVSLLHILAILRRFYLHFSLAESNFPTGQTADSNFIRDLLQMSYWSWTASNFVWQQGCNQFFIFSILWSSKYNSLEKVEPHKTDLN